MNNTIALVEFLMCFINCSSNASVSSDAPVTMTKMLGSSELQKGKIVRLECELSAENKPVTWLKDNREIEVGVKYQVVTDGKSQVLLIKDFQSADQGAYSCVASEEAKTSVNLNLEGTLLGITSHLTVIVWK